MATSGPPPLRGASSENWILFTLDWGWSTGSQRKYSCIYEVLAHGPVPKYWRQFVVNLCHDIICTSGIGVTPFCDHICHTSRKMSMILSVCSPTRCLRKFTWHFLEKRKVAPELIIRRARKNLGNGELQMLQMRKMLSSGFRISNSWMQKAISW